MIDLSHKSPERGQRKTLEEDSDDESVSIHFQSTPSSPQPQTVQVQSNRRTADENVLKTLIEELNGLEFFVNQYIVTMFYKEEGHLHFFFK